MALFLLARLSRPPQNTLAGEAGSAPKLVEPDRRSPIKFSAHAEYEGAVFFKAAAELGLEGIISKRAVSLYQSGPSRSWVKTKNMIGGRVRGARHRLELPR